MTQYEETQGDDEQETLEEYIEWHGKADGYMEIESSVCNTGCRQFFMPAEVINKNSVITLLTKEQELDVSCPDDLGFLNCSPQPED